MASYDPAADRVHGAGWNSAARWGGWSWREPRYGDHFRTCSFCGSIHPEDVAAELVAERECKTCGRAGWEACFTGQQPSWYAEAKASGKLADLPAAQLADFDARPPAHSYDVGGAYASWADRKYGWPHKFYVKGLKPRDPSQLHILSHITFDPAESSMAERDWIQAADLTAEQREIAKADGWLRDGEEPNGSYLFAPRLSLHAKFYTIHLADPAIGQDVKDAIQRASGLRFTWTDDGRVGWECWTD